MAREIGLSRVLIVGACRDVDPTLADPLKTTLTELAREPVSRTLTLAGLAEADVTRLIALAAPAVPAMELGAAVYGETEGNPLSSARSCGCSPKRGGSGIRRPRRW